MAWTRCPDCNTFVSVRSARTGSQFQCSECGSELEVTSVDPFDAVMSVASLSGPAVPMPDGRKGVGGENVPGPV